MTTPDEFNSAAIQAFRNGDIDTALQLTAEAISQFPDEPAVYTSRVGLLAALDENEQALQCLDQLIALDDSNANGWFSKGRFLQDIDRLDDATAAYRQAVTVDAEHLDSWVNLGCVLDDAGQHEAAIEAYDRAIEIDDTEEISWNNRGNSLTALGRHDEAVKSYQRALALGDEAAFTALRSALVYAGRVGEANALMGDESDRQGEARECCAKVGDRVLVARYFIGRHTNPEMLDSAVEDLVEFTASRDEHPPGLSDGVTIFYFWSVLTIRERGNDLILCEPEMFRDATASVREEVSFTAQHVVMMHMIHGMIDAPPEPCSCHSLVNVDPAAFDSDAVVMTRRRPTADDHSGWTITAEDDESVDTAPVPMSQIAPVRPHWCKVATLPFRWTAHFEGHRVVRILDENGNDRMDQK